MHGVPAPAFVVFAGVGFHDRDTLAVIGDEALEIFETRHLSGPALHLADEFEIATFHASGVKPGPKYGEESPAETAQTPSRPLSLHLVGVAVRQHLIDEPVLGLGGDPGLAHDGQRRGALRVGG